jgi:outer membrane phospholipase A
VVNYEKGEAQRIGAKLHKNSGRGKMQKADATWNEFIVDFKHFSKSFSLSQSVWAKICTDTLKTDRTKNPALMLVIGEGNKKVRLAVIEWEVFEELRSNGNNS